jgi:enamine deaminase RidA (YjgF/YER057c/UK114 family)
MNEKYNVGVSAKIGLYSDGVVIPPGARVLHTSGTPGIDGDGMLPEDFVGQATLAWENIHKILAGAGMGVEDIVKINQFLVRPEDMPAYREVRTRALGDARPASTLLFVPALVWPNMLIEVEVIAAK